MKKIVSILVVVFMLLVMCPMEKIHADYIFVQPDEFEEISEGSVLTFGDHSFTFNGLELLEDKNEVKASFTYDTNSPIYNYHVYDLAIFVWRDYALYFEQENIVEANRITEKLNEYNKKRQEIEKKMFEEAVQKIEQENLKEKNAIVLGGENWHHGVIG